MRVRRARSRFVCIIRELRHGDEAVGGTELDAVIVCTAVLDVGSMFKMYLARSPIECTYPESSAAALRPSGAVVAPKLVHHEDEADHRPLFGDGRRKPCRLFVNDGMSAVPFDRFVSERPRPSVEPRGRQGRLSHHGAHVSFERERQLRNSGVNV